MSPAFASYLLVFKTILQDYENGEALVPPIRSVWEVQLLTPNISEVSASANLGPLPVLDISNSFNKEVIVAFYKRWLSIISSSGTSVIVYPCITIKSEVSLFDKALSTVTGSSSS